MITIPLKNAEGATLNLRLASWDVAKIMCVPSAVKVSISEERTVLLDDEGTVNLTYQDGKSITFTKAQLRVKPEYSEAITRQFVLS